jgi:hypothetical protein
MIESQRFLKRALIRRSGSRLGGRRNSGIDFPTVGRELAESVSAAGLASWIWDCVASSLVRFDFLRFSFVRF